MPETRGGFHGLDRFREEKDAAQEIDKGIRSGSICFLCLEELNPPGGATNWSFDGKTMRRVCPGCKEKIDRSRE